MLEQLQDEMKDCNCTGRCIIKQAISVSANDIPTYEQHTQ